MPKQEEKETKIIRSEREKDRDRYVMNYVRAPNENDNNKFQIEH